MIIGWNLICFFTSGFAGAVQVKLPLESTSGDLNFEQEVNCFLVTLTQVGLLKVFLVEYNKSSMVFSFLNIARVQNCPDVTRLNSLFGLRLLSFCLFVFLSWQHSDQMSEGSQVSKVTLCVKIQKWYSASHSLTNSLTKVRYRAARAAKNPPLIRQGKKYKTPTHTIWKLFVTFNNLFTFSTLWLPFGSHVKVTLSPGQNGEVSSY